MDPSMPASWTLSPAEHDAIFNEQIGPTEIDAFIPDPRPTATTQPSRRPIAIIVVGQTGAGKTHLAPRLADAFHTPETPGLGPAHLIADTYKSYHPFYAACLSRFPSHVASRLAGPHARRWLHAACERAAAARIDVLVESACRYAQDFTALASVFVDAGYAVRIAVLAVPEPLSRLGVMVRYYCRPDGHETTTTTTPASARGTVPLPPRRTPRAIHDESYAGLVAAAASIDADPALFDGVVVVRRGLGVAYAAPDAVPGVVEALSRERLRALPRDEYDDAMRDLAVLRASAPAEEADEIQEIQDMLMMVFASDRTREPLPVLKVFDAVRFVWEGRVAML